MHAIITGNAAIEKEVGVLQFYLPPPPYGGMRLACF